ncbi:mitochondrial carrier domain-containing protein [Catenaria anguillulae PL171]|uniref:Mitochondrial carrier domain-containing protein n=1 Tax=Catenaria anguillulae PL171 TaxID=765915 RepID=A0A1Y2HK18_9FUNG|nr:mitochondrial carrier domain-containing protein [Catenaria anguillulae PL171]
MNEWSQVSHSMHVHVYLSAGNQPPPPASHSTSTLDHPSTRPLAQRNPSSSLSLRVSSHLAAPTTPVRQPSEELHNNCCSKFHPVLTVMSAPALQVHSQSGPSPAAPAIALRTQSAQPPKPVVVTNAASKPTVPPAVHLVAGGFAGSVGAIVTCPLEVVKTRLQSDIYRNEGIWAFWKGIGPTLAGVIPARAIYFATYNESKRALTALNNGRESSPVVMTSAIAAGTATPTGTGTAAPLYRNSWDCFLKVVRNEGFFTLYRGLSASLIGISEGTIQWLIYEHLKRLRATHQPDPLTSSSSSTSPSTAHVIRTRMRETPADGSAVYKYNGIVQSFKTIVREEGPRALYGGMGVHLLRVVPNSAIMFVCYESVVHLAQRWAVEAEAAAVVAARQ